MILSWPRAAATEAKASQRAPFTPVVSILEVVARKLSCEQSNQNAMTAHNHLSWRLNERTGLVSGCVHVRGLQIALEIIYPAPRVCKVRRSTLGPGCHEAMRRFKVGHWWENRLTKKRWHRYQPCNRGGPSYWVPRRVHRHIASNLH